jgi:hypothetical protein
MRVFMDKALNEQILIRSHEEGEHPEIENGDGIMNSFETAKLQSLLSVAPCVMNGSPNNFFALKERVVAAESCEFVSQVSLFFIALLRGFFELGYRF